MSFYLILFILFYFVREKPEQKSVAFKFATTFPPKVLDDENQVDIYIVVEYIVSN